jgi:hypothetical protein
MFNTDEACKGMVTAGCGGIIRDGRGVCSAFTAELWGWKDCGLCGDWGLEPWNLMLILHLW